MKVTEITFNDVQTQPEFAPIWVRNNLHHSPAVRHEGDLLVGIPKLNGSKVDLLRVERTWLPIDATAQIPRRQLLECAEFRQAVNARYLILISDDSARRLLSRPEAIAEQERLELQREFIRTATGALAVGPDVVHTNADNDQAPSDDKQVMQEYKRAPKDLTTEFLNWVATVPTKSDIELLSDLRTRALTRKQAKRILRVADPKTQTKSVALLSKSLAR